MKLVLLMIGLIVGVFLGALLVIIRLIVSCGEIMVVRLLQGLMLL